MKKRITLLLLSALLLTTTACGHPMNDAHNETTDSIPLNQPTEQISETAENEIEKPPIHSNVNTNGFPSQDSVTYTKHYQNDGTLHIRLYMHDWDKSYLISLEELFDENIPYSTSYKTAIAIHGDQAKTRE